MEALHIKLKPEAERIIAEICVTAYLRHLKQQQSEQPTVSEDGEAKKGDDAA